MMRPMRGSPRVGSWAWLCAIAILFSSGCASGLTVVADAGPGTPSQLLPADEAAACATTEDGIAPTPTTEAYVDLLVGIWALCDAASAFGGDEKGLEIGVDGHWWKLQRDASGGLARVEGWGNEGSWETIDTSAMNGPGAYQLNLAIDGSGTYITQPVFATNVPKMRLTNYSMVADYVRTDATTNPTGKEEAQSYPSDNEACAAVENGIEPTPTERRFVELFVGIWSLCNTPSVFGSDDAGLEIAADGHWWKLADDLAGGLTRAEGWGNEGTWAVLDTSVMNGPGHYQLNLAIDGSGTVTSQPVFATTPPKMRLNNMGVYVGDYVRALT